MRIIRAVVVAVAAIGLLGPAGTAHAKAASLKLSISNFRYCAGEECTPLDAGYVRSSSGPVSGTDNPSAPIDVKRGTVVMWVYRDGFCDMLGCP